MAAIFFFNVSGGPYGIEDMVPAFGPGMTLALLLLTPLFWSLPVALAMSELAAALPDEGGYVTWTRRAFGPFWAFQVGWWSWIDSFVDVAVYPALFVEYARFWYPAVTPGARWLLVVGFIVVLTALNVVGVRPTGRAAVVLAVAALLPIAALALVGLGTARVSPWTPLVPEGQGIEALGLGLAVVMWNYSGWDTPATVLGETRAPERTFRLAALLALPVLTASYVAPVGVALASGAIEWHAWTTGALPVIARRIGGDWLGHAVAAGGRWPPLCSRRSSRSPPSRPRAGSTRWRAWSRPSPGRWPGARSGVGRGRESGRGAHERRHRVCRVRRGPAGRRRSHPRHQ